MSVVYILAHFDDEYCALPLMWQARRDGLDQRFLYMADYSDAAMAARRLAETRGFLRAHGVSVDAVQHLGAGTGAFDQSVWRTLDVLWPKLSAAVGEVGAVDHIVVPAFEGGHMDHDACAAMGARLGRELAVDVRQFSLYNGRGIGAPWLRGATPLPQNGAVNRVSLSLAEWLRWMAAVRWFPSQLYAWSGIWPAMFWSFARRGFGWQALAPGRTAERPHEGVLYYERAFRTPYAEVRAALDAFSRGSSAT
jgi:LmbE family N-acetylglucosaminyl deacetylase